MARLFGTDGVRGIAITQLTCELSTNIGKALVKSLKKNNPTIIIGRDTRRSSQVLEAALISGIASVGGNVQILGVVPTPAVAYLVRKYKADAGIMITASHNSAEFNGIKLFNSDGSKFPDDKEDEMEAIIKQLEKSFDAESLKEGGEVGEVVFLENAAQDYKSYLISLSTEKLDGIKLLVDCANGSSCNTAFVLSELGASCTFINNKPNGININDRCGSTHMDILSKKMKGEYDLAVAFDGDADRMLAIDDKGNFIDGDKIIAILANSLKEKGELNSDTVVVTVMSNLGFHKYMREHNLKTSIVQVGDRYVLEEMNRQNYSIGGEQSGHIIFKKYATTGDGLLTAIMLLNTIKTSGKTLYELASEIPEFPQTLKNITISESKRGLWETNPKIAEVIDKVKEKAGDESRILIRESGTEPLLRVMIEGKIQSEIEEWADEICLVAKAELS